MLLSCKPWMCKWLDVCRNSAEEAGRRTAWNFTCHRWWDSRARHQCTLWLCFQVHVACMCLCALDIYAFKRKLSFKRFCTELLLKQIQNEIKQKVCPIFYLLAIFIEISKPNNKHNKNYLLTTVFCCVFSWIVRYDFVLVFCSDFRSAWNCCKIISRLSADRNTWQQQEAVEQLHKVSNKPLLLHEGAKKEDLSTYVVVCGQTDFLLVLLHDMVQAFPDLHVVLMSATVDTTLFCDYFAGCHVVEVHGRVHPVQGWFLSSLLCNTEGLVHFTCIRFFLPIPLKVSSDTGSPW